MNRQEAVNEYRQARRRGMSQYREDIREGKYPYPAVLEELLEESSVAGRVELGLVEIPMSGITGITTSGRQRAFSTGFMPLLEPDTEFADKWVTLCEAHLGSEGIRDPVRCFEYLGHFYVQEGNKRVSVLKFFDAPVVTASVLRILPKWQDTPQVRQYYEFLSFYQRSGLYIFRLEEPGAYEKLQAALGFEKEHVWTEEEQRQVKSAFVRFCQGAVRANVPGDASLSALFLNWLTAYSPEELFKLEPEQLRLSITALLPELGAGVALSTEDAPAQKGVLERLWGAVTLPSHLHAAFIHAYSPEQSDWSAAHEQGRLKAQEALTGKVSSSVYWVGMDGMDADGCMARAAAEGAQVLFATAPSLITACRKAAAAYPHIKILNCSVAMPYPGVRTYYCRIYEGKFIAGALAGAMTRTDTLGYIASSPIFGVPAGINAFALGARLTNPRARVLLRWSCVEDNSLPALLAAGADLISNRDLPFPGRPREQWGLNLLEANGTVRSLGSPIWNWGIFYEKLLKGILQGHWGDTVYDSEPRALNYWWGMGSGVVDLQLSHHLPEGMQTLAGLLREDIARGRLQPFRRAMQDQQTQSRSNGDRDLSPQEILHMDWLCDNVEGHIPAFEELLPQAQNLVRLEGVYRQWLPPVAGGPIL